MADLEFIPGTVHLIDVHHTLFVEKTDTKEDIILQPQPLENVNDPLKWLQRKKNIQFLMLFFWGVVLAAAVNWPSPYYVQWGSQFGASGSKINIFQGLRFVFLGVGCVFLQPTALKLGKRFVYLLCTIIAIVGNAVGVRAKTIGQLYATSVLVGFAAAPVDSLVEVSSTDLFFTHERATRLSLLVLALYFGNDIGPVVAGYLPLWNWAFLLLVILLCAIFAVFVFVLEDTSFPRLEKASEEGILEQIKSNNQNSQNSEKKQFDIEQASVEVGYVGPQKRTYLERMRIFELEYNDKRPWLVIFARPLYTACFPAVIWSGIAYGAQMMWLTLMGVTQSQIYIDSYKFNTLSTGLTNLSALVGSLAGMVYGGWFVDWLSMKIAKRNNGILEAEFRLWAMIFPTIVNAGGLLAYGLAANNKLPWPIPVVLGQGLLGFAMSSVGPICLTYAVECYPKLASELLVLMLFLRNMIGCIFTFSFGYWMQRDGLVLTTWLMFMLSIVINGVFVVFLIWGKSFRIRTKDFYTSLT